MELGVPNSNEYSDFHKAFVSRVPDSRVEELLVSQLNQFPEFLALIPEDQVGRIHAPYLWTIHQVVEHIVDAERVYGYLTLRFAVGDGIELPGWDEVAYADSGYSRNATLIELGEEFVQLRQSNISLLKRLDPSRLTKTGTADKREFSVRAIAYLMVGHLIHHHAILISRLGGTP